MHVRDLRAFGWLETARHYLATCEVFATEFDFSETDEAALALALKLPDDKTLDQFLKPGVWKNLDFYCRKELGIPADAMRRQHPMTVTTALTAAFMADESAHSLDETLWHDAQALGKCAVLLGGTLTVEMGFDARPSTLPRRQGRRGRRLRTTLRLLTRAVEDSR